ncbi:Uncharacterized protein (Fragment) OS=uncultured bacterium PE=4 SV=1 [Gemmata massiliana]|uniref:SMI1/KNR4 family protein n=1 Tax=Gemmata massiliana TaxID=1210884 RepID=A0A6P2D2B5_9BACT
MTEAEWLVCENPPAMLRALSDRASDRKLRLFTTICCRWVQQKCGESLELENAVSYVAVLERRADEVSNAAEWSDALLWVSSSQNDIIDQTLEAPTADCLAFFCAIHDDAPEAAFWSSVNANIALSNFSRRPEVDELAGSPESRFQAPLLRDIFGKPFRTMSFSPDWRTATTVALAAQMYESREFSAMPILADALQDAGCDNADMLDHCRDANTPHVRGCWVVDVVLGKE